MATLEDKYFNLTGTGFPLEPTEIDPEMIKPVLISTSDGKKFFNGESKTGTFSPNNPYLQNLFQSSSADKGAMYELAVKWEAEYAALMENREYNDPKNEIARQRAAGIDPTIPGSGSGSGSGSSPILFDPPTDNSAKFGTEYDARQLKLQGMSVAANWLSAFTSFGGTVATAFDMMSTLPSRMRISETQADIAEQTADDVIGTASAQRNAVDLANVQSNLDFVSQLGGLFTSESTDDDITSILGTLGIAEDRVPGLLKTLRHAQKNPEWIANYNESVKAARKTTEENGVYTSQVYRDLITNGLRIEQFHLEMQEDQVQLEARIADYLNTEENAENVADLQMASNAYARQDLGFKRQQLARDIEAYTKNIEDLVQIYNQLEEDKQKIHDSVYEKVKLGLSRGYSPALLAQLRSIELMQMQIGSLGSHSVQNAYNFVRNSAKQSYLNTFNLDYQDNVEPITGFEKHSVFVSYTFDDLLTNQTTTPQFASSLLSLIPVVGGVAAEQLISGYNGATQNGGRFGTKNRR